MKEQRFKSKKVGTIDVAKHTKPHKTPTRNVIDEATGKDGVVDGVKLMNIISPKRGTLSKDEKAARAKAAKELIKVFQKGALGVSIHALRKELTKDDDGEDFAL